MPFVYTGVCADTNGNYINKKKTTFDVKDWFEQQQQQRHWGLFDVQWRSIDYCIEWRHSNDRILCYCIWCIVLSWRWIWRLCCQRCCFASTNSSFSPSCRMFSDFSIIISLFLYFCKGNTCNGLQNNWNVCVIIYFNLLTTKAAPTAAPTTTATTLVSSIIDHYYIFRHN